MEKYKKPYWLLVAISLPQLFIFLIFFKLYGIIGSQLEAGNIEAWRSFGAVLGGLWLLFTAYAVVSLARRKALNPLIGFGILPAYIAFLYLFLVKSGTIVPWSIPDWMLLGIRPEVMVLTLMMPAFVYGMLLLVFRFTPRDRQHEAWKNMIGAIVIPLSWYLFVNILIPLTHVNTGQVVMHAVAVTFIACTLLFFFFLTRFIFILLMQKPRIWQVARIPVIILFPTLGLLVNNGVAKWTPVEFSFGNFSNPAFYVFALLTGGLLLLPEFDSRMGRLAVFFGKSLTLSYPIYFFFVFLPYLPLSIIAIIAAGLGFLMLTPLVLTLIHVKSLWNDFMFLANSFKKYQLVPIFAAGILILPAAVTVSFAGDRINLDKALQYVYQPDYGADPVRIDLSGIRRTLDNIKANKEDGRIQRIASTKKMPYLSSYYNKLVLNNLTLPEEKIKTMESIFFGEPVLKNESTAQNTASRDVELQDLRVETTYDPQGGFYRSWLHFELRSGDFAQSEFSTVFELPEGSRISGYYLDVNGQRKQGLLTDKRAALWVYNQIKNWRRDPGILYYGEDGRVVFQVFPFGPSEVRKTGIEVIHADKVSLNIAGKDVVLGTPENTDTAGGTANEGGTAKAGGTVNLLGGKAVYIPASGKDGLAKIQRKPHYYFLIDFSKAAAGKTGAYLERVENFIMQSGIEASQADVEAVNYSAKLAGDRARFKTELGGVAAEGGYFFDNAAKRILYGNYAERSPERPVIIAVTDDMDNAVFAGGAGIGAFKAALPEDGTWYVLDKDGTLKGQTADGGQSGADSGFQAQKAVLAWPDADDPLAYLPDDGKPSLFLSQPAFDFKSVKLEGETWENALALQAMDLSLGLNPGKYPGNFLEAVRNSFRCGMMNSLTSFIVVENEAQEKVLLEKQKQLLSSNSALDAGEETRMSEPSLWLVAVLAGGVLLIARRRRSKAQV